MGIVAHELLHVWQFTCDSALYADCVTREVVAYRLEASVLRAWCKANPSLQYGISVDSRYLMSVAEEGSRDARIVRREGELWTLTPPNWPDLTSGRSLPRPLA